MTALIFFYWKQCSAYCVHSKLSLSNSVGEYTGRGYAVVCACLPGRQVPTNHFLLRQFGYTLHTP